MQRLVEEWPVDVERVALLGHSMGGLILRAACAVATGEDRPWVARVTDLVTLGTPHLGAPLAAGVGSGARALARLPETAAFGRVTLVRWLNDAGEARPKQLAPPIALADLFARLAAAT